MVSGEIMRVLRFNKKKHPTNKDLIKLHDFYDISSGDGSNNSKSSKNPNNSKNPCQGFLQ